MNKVTVIFEENKYNYSTSVSKESTPDTASHYFVGKYFDIGHYPVENFQKCIGIEFNDEKVDLTLNQKLMIAEIHTIRLGNKIYLQKGDVRIIRPTPTSDVESKINKAFNIELIKD